MHKIKIPKDRIRKLRTLSLGKKVYEFENFENNCSKTLIDLCSNDYFGLSRDNEVIKAAHEISLTEGLGSGGSRFISGSRPIHELLEGSLAKWLCQEKVLLFPSGFQANIAAVQALSDRNTIVIADRFIHNSLLVGVQASGGKLVRFLHNDLDDLEKKLSKNYHRNKSFLVIVESLYSMEGTIAPLKEITKLCKKYKAKLLVDEAHALGILGPKGKGLGIQSSDSIDIISGTLGKSFGSGGAFLACNSKISEMLIQTSGAFRYTTALSPTLAAGALKSLQKIEKNIDWGLNLLNFSKRWKDAIQNIGKFYVKGDCHILSIIIGDDKDTLLFQRFLEHRGFLAVAIRPPTVPRGESRIRITIRRTLDESILKNFISALEEYK